MTIKLPSAVFLAVALVGASLAPAYADRTPNADERARIEQTLRGAGYTSWEEIEFDDGVWEVDDARKVAGGQDCDIEIDPRTYAIVETDC